MLVEFQQALADLTASPEFCIEVRRNPEVLRQRYRLTEREYRRALGIVRHPGMACACTVYRANRLAPLALNLPKTCRALGDSLRAIVSEYWAAHPEGNVHFFIETDRFCRFLMAKLARGSEVPAATADILAAEAAAVSAALLESQTETDPYGPDPSAVEPSH